jgi:CRP/FNR family transcriptional regulator, cyclic AMP receptor protein
MRSLAQPPQQTTLLSAAPEHGAQAPDLLARLTPAARAAVLGLGRRRHYRVGETLFLQGDTHDGIFLIESGLVKSYYVSEDGRELTLGFWAGGHYVGAPQMFGGSQHAWTSLAAAHTECLWLSGPQLRELSTRHNDLALALIDALVHKSQCYCALLQLLATHSMRVRLARLLGMLSAREGGAVTGLSHHELAGMIGSTRQWVSLSMARFQDEGLLVRRSAGYEVPDRHALEAVR